MADECSKTSAEQPVQDSTKQLPDGFCLRSTTIDDLGQRAVAPWSAEEPSVDLSSSPFGEVLDLWSFEHGDDDHLWSAELKKCDHVLDTLRTRVWCETQQNHEDRPLSGILARLSTMGTEEIEALSRRLGEDFNYIDGPALSRRASTTLRVLHQEQMRSQHLSPEYLVRILDVTALHVEKSLDSRQDRFSEQLEVWQRRAGDEVKPFSLYPDDFEYLLYYARDLALENRNRNSCSTGCDRPGSQVLQRMLVLSDYPAQLAIVNQLIPYAKLVLYHESGCFVVSQILQEALSADCLTRAAHNFMLCAHEWTGDAWQKKFHDNLYRSMTDMHANHSFQMWLPLLSRLSGLPDVAASSFCHFSDLRDVLWASISEVTRANAATLSMHQAGVRTLNTMLRCYEEHQLRPIINELVENDDLLDTLMKHQFANHAIQLIIPFEYDRIAGLVYRNFAEYARGDYANYVVQACITHCDSCSRLTKLTDAFLHAYGDPKAQAGRAFLNIRRCFENKLAETTFSDRQTKLQLARRLDDECPVHWGKNKEELRQRQWALRGTPAEMCKHWRRNAKASTRGPSDSPQKEDLTAWAWM